MMGVEPKRRVRMPPAPFRSEQLCVFAAVCLHWHFNDFIRTVARASGVLAVPGNEWKETEELHPPSEVWPTVMAGVPLDRATGHGSPKSSTRLAVSSQKRAVLRASGPDGRRATDQVHSGTQAHTTLRHTRHSGTHDTQAHARHTALSLCSKRVGSQLRRERISHRSSQQPNRSQQRARPRLPTEPVGLSGSVGWQHAAWRAASPRWAREQPVTRPRVHVTPP
jgi:hypothetical protein